MYGAGHLRVFAETLLRKSGLTLGQAQQTAEVLLEGDLLGHTTHGLQLLAPYLRDIEAGRMCCEGEPIVIVDHAGALTWDGRFLPGPWLVLKAMEAAFERIAAHAVVIRRSHHIACLAAYLKRATDRGLVMLLSCSDPGVASVAPMFRRR
jgi:LDH2 family malate/lactate/ureidoglycolate dehydrogenase